MKFYEGQQLLSIFWEDGEIETGKRGHKEIVVVMENGEMAGVPWAEVTKEDGSIYKYNLKMCHGVMVK